MNGVRLAAQAEADLDEIWLHIARDSVEAANRVVDSITERFRLLCGSPNIGRKRDELVPGMRSFVVGNYLIFYNAIAAGIEVVRVLHGPVTSRISSDWASPDRTVRTTPVPVSVVPIRRL